MIDLVRQNQLIKLTIEQIINTGAFFEVAIQPGSCLSCLELDNRLNDTHTLDRLSAWIKGTRTLEHLKIRLCSELATSSKIEFFDSLACSKSLVDITVAAPNLTSDSFVALLEFLSITKVFKLRLQSLSYPGTFNLSHILRALAKNESLHSFSIWAVGSVQCDPQALFELLKTTPRLGILTLLDVDMSGVSLNEFTEALKENNTFLNIRCVHVKFSSQPQIVRNQNYHLVAAQSEAFHLMNNARLVASARPNSKKGYRIPLELIEKILLESNLTEKYWPRKDVKVIARVLRSRESIGQVKQYSLGFDSYSLYYVCQKWLLLRM